MAADLTNLFEAMYKRYALFTGPTDAYTLTTGRIYRAAAPAGATVPYIVVTQVGGSILEMFSRDSIESATIQMSVYDRFKNDASGASQIMQSLIHIFNWCALYIPSDETYIRMRREAMQKETVEDRTYIHIWQDWTAERQVPSWR